MNKIIINKLIINAIEKCTRSPPTTDSNVVFADYGESIDDIFREYEEQENERKVKVYDLNNIADELVKQHPNFHVKRVNNKDTFTLVDDEYGVEIKLGQFINRQDLIDFTSENPSNISVSLNDFIDYYENIPSGLKELTSRIILENNNNKRNRNVYWTSEFPGDYNNIYITPQAFVGDNRLTGGVRRMLAHEFTHSIDIQYKFNDYDKQIITKVENKIKLTPREEGYLSDLMDKIDNSRLSNSLEYKRAFHNDDGTHVSSYGADWALHNNGELKEDFAETGSMVILGSDGVIRSHTYTEHTPLGFYTTGDLIGLDEFIRNNPNQYSYLYKLLKK